MPPDVIKAKITPYRRQGKPWHRSRLQNLDDYDIVRIYGAEYRGVVNYYLLAQDVWRLGTLQWNAQTSMLKTLAAKHKSSVTKMAARYKAKIETSDGRRTCFEARGTARASKDLVARFGGISSGKTGGRSSMTPPRPGALPPKGADQTAPQTGVRAVRARHNGDRPPGRRRSKHLGQAGTGPARVGRTHGKNAAQDPHRLRGLP